MEKTLHVHLGDKITTTVGDVPLTEHDLYRVVYHLERIVESLKYAEKTADALVEMEG